MAAVERPNIIFILADDLGRNDISFYGQGGNGVRTPGIDQIFRGGVSFTNSYANSPVCSPTRAALMTGLYPDRAGVPGVVRQQPENSWGHMREDVKLLPARLKQAGYRTAMVGKWHLGYESPNLPNDRGFDTFRGFLGDMMDDYYTHLRGGRNWMRFNREEVKPEGHATELFSRWSVEMVKELAGGGEPFFLYLAYNAPHDPIQPGQKWLEGVRRSRPELDEKRAKLVALIEQMDDGVGQVLDAVREAGIEKKTLIVFTSDNGGQLNLGADNGAWRGTKGQTYEGGLRVVCGAMWPGFVPAGLKASVPAMTADWFATLLDVAGVDLRGVEKDGRSLKQVLEHPSNNEGFEGRELYFVRREGGPGYAGKTIEALRVGNWKLVLNTPMEAAGLYDLGADPYEQEDLSLKAGGKKREMIQKLQLHIQRGGEVPWQFKKVKDGEK